MTRSKPPPQPIQAAIDAADEDLSWWDETRSTNARYAIAAFLRALPEGTTIALALDGERRIRTAHEVANMVAPAND